MATKYISPAAIASFGIAGVLLITAIFILSQSGQLTINSYDWSRVCAGTKEDLCWATINFTMKNTTCFEGSSDWRYIFNTDQQIKNVRVYRNGNLMNTSNNFCFNKGQNIVLNFTAEKYSPYDTIKWGFAELDPIWEGVANITLVGESSDITGGIALLRIDPGKNYTIKFADINGWVEKIGHGGDLTEYKIRVGKNTSHTEVSSLWIPNVTCSNLSVSSQANGTNSTVTLCIDRGYVENKTKEYWSIGWQEVGQMDGSAWSGSKNSLNAKAGEPIYAEVSAKWQAQLGYVIYFWKLNMSNMTIPSGSFQDAVDAKSRDWWDTSWGYDQCFNLTQNMAEDAVNATFNLTFNTAALVSAGKMQADYDDLRVIDNASNTALNFNWSVFNSSDINVFFKVPNNFTASATDLICFYYGNPAATAAGSDWRDVYQEYDNFNDNSLNTTIWTLTGTNIKEADNHLNLYSGTGSWSANYVVTNRRFDQPVKIEFEWREIASVGYGFARWGTTGSVDVSSGNHTSYYWNTDKIEMRNVMDGGYTIQQWSTGTTANIWYNGTITVNRTAVYMERRTEGAFALLINATTYGGRFIRNGNSIYLNVYGDTAVNITLDNFRVSTYLYASPTYSAFGSEQAVPQVNNPSILKPTFIEFVYSDSGSMANMTFNYSSPTSAKGNITAYCMNNSGAQEISKHTFINIATDTFMSYNCTAGDPAVLENWTIQANATDSAGLESSPNMTSQTVIGRINGFVLDGSNGNAKMSAARVVIVNQSNNASVGTATTNTTGGWAFNLSQSGKYFATAYFNTTLNGAGSPYIDVT